MPIFEYQCKSCGKQAEYLLKSQQEKPQCTCGSRDLEKKFSAFAVSEGQSSAHAGCSDGSCGIQAPSCASGMCGLN